MKQLFLLLVFGLIARTGFAQIYFTMDSIWAPPYICQATHFDVEVYGNISSGMIQATTQNYFVRQDTIYAQFHFGPSAGGTATPRPMARTINIPAPPDFASYKIMAQGFYNGQLQHTLTSSIVICWNTTLATSEEIEKEPQLSIFPNPATDRVLVKLPFPSKSHALKITDAAGKTVRIAEIGNALSETQLDLQNLPSGLYFLEASTAGKKITAKLLKH